MENQACGHGCTVDLPYCPVAPPLKCLKIGNTDLRRTKGSKERERKKQTTNKGLMHSRIIQIADSPIDKENFLDEDSIETGPNSLVDYTAEISEKERQLAIENLVNHWLPKGMFSLGTDPDTIVYNGGMDDWLGKEWLPKIRQAAQNLSTYNVFKSLNLYRMERLLDNALDIGTLFYISSDNYQSYAERSTAFMEYINEYPEGHVFYIGGVLDYHW